MIDGCLPCSFTARLPDLPPREAVWVDEHWRVAHCVRREVAEELGLELAPGTVGPRVWRRTVDFSWAGTTFRQAETFHLVRRPRFVPERCVDEGYDFEHRWWSAAEIEASDERFAPDGLAGHLARLVADGPPVAPIDVSSAEGGAP